MPESSHPPAAITVSGEAGSTTCVAEGDGDTGVGVDISVDAFGPTGAVDACNDEGEIVAATSAPDGLAAPAQPAMARMITAITTSDLVIG